MAFGSEHLLQFLLLGFETCGVVTLKCCALTLCAVYLNQSIFIVAGAGLANLQYYHIEILYFVMCSTIESGHLLQLLLKAWELIVLTHCGRVTQICVFNTVKLGTSASSP